MGEMRRLYYQTKEKGSFKTFKWLLKGRWNQGTGNSGTTRTYQQWDELGISYVGSDGVKYGPTYWTVDSYSSSGSLWSSRPASEMFDGEWGSETSKSDYKDINDTDGYVEIIIHTTSGEAIIPNGVGLISCSNQSSYASATPAHFILYGLDESTNEYVQLIDVGAANVNKGNTQTTTVSFEPVEVVSGTYYLLAPSDIARGSGLRFEMPDLNVLCNLGDTQYGANTTFDLTGVPDSISDRYVMYHTELANFQGVNDVYYKSTAGSWRMRCYSSGMGFVGITSLVSGWTTATGVTGISSFTADSISYRQWSGFGKSYDWRPMRIIIDQEELKAHTFLNGTYVGYATVKSGIVTAPIKQIQLTVEVNIRPQARNVRVVSSNDYQALVDWADA